ncbi:MAG: synthase subunit [Verrucomicrobiota bacterium]|jgi:F-type H+-transporting ATPase subunit a
MNVVKTLIFALLLALLPASLSAADTTVSGPATAAVEQVAKDVHGAAAKTAATEESHTLPMQAPRLLKGGEGTFQVTNSLVAMFVVAAILILFAQVATRAPQLVPQGAQNFAEWVVESLVEFLSGILGEKMARKTFWFFGSIFIFILTANWFGLVPGVGSIGWGHDTAHGFHVTHPLLRGANADLNMTLALALFFFGMWLYWSIQANGVGGFFSHIFVYHGEATGGMRLLLVLIFFLVGFLEVISILIRPVSLTFRLYGNIYAGESLLEMMLHLGGHYFGWLAALPFFGLELMVGMIQALVFTLLTAVFTALMCKHDEEHAAEGHAGHAEGHSH